MNTIKLFCSDKQLLDRSKAVLKIGTQNLPVFRSFEEARRSYWDTTDRKGLEGYWALRSWNDLIIAKVITLNDLAAIQDLYNECPHASNSRKVIISRWDEVLTNQNLASKSLSELVSLYAHILPGSQMQHRLLRLINDSAAQYIEGISEIEPLFRLCLTLPQGSFSKQQARRKIIDMARMRRDYDILVRFPEIFKAVLDFDHTVHGIQHASTLKQLERPYDNLQGDLEYLMTERMISLCRSALNDKALTSEKRQKVMGRLLALHAMSTYNEILQEWLEQALTMNGLRTVASYTLIGSELEKVTLQKFRVLLN